MDNLIAKARTSVPKSFRSTEVPSHGSRTHGHIPNKKLRAQLDRQSAQKARSKALVDDAGLLLPSEAGKIIVEGDLERTWRISQDEIVKEVGIDTARGRKEMVLDGGPYRSRYTRNGR